MKNDMCYFCRKQGHWSKECPQKRQGGVTGPSNSRGAAIDDPCIPDRLCPCGAGVCPIKTSKTQANPGRKFYSCPLYPSSGYCKFFEWCGEASSSRGVDPKVNVTVPSYPECSCGAGKGRLYTTSEGRKYFGCHIKKGEGACNFFQWYDSLESDSKDNVPYPSSKMASSNNFEGENNEIERSLSNLSINKEHVPLSKVKSDMLSPEVAKNEADNSPTIMAQDPEEVQGRVQPRANMLDPTTKVQREADTLKVDVEQAIPPEQGRPENEREEQASKEIKQGGQDVMEEETETLLRVAEQQMTKKENVMQKITEEMQKNKIKINTADAENSADGVGGIGGKKQRRGEPMKMDDLMHASVDASLDFSEDDLKMESEANLSSSPVSVLNRSPKTILEGLGEQVAPGITRLNCQNQGNAKLRPGDQEKLVTSVEFYKLLSAVQAASVLAKHMETISSTYTSLRTMIKKDKKNMTSAELEIARAKFEVECLRTALSAAEFKLKQAEENMATLKMSLKMVVDDLLPSAEQAIEQLNDEQANVLQIAAKVQQVLGACSFVACHSTMDLRAGSSSMGRDDGTSETPDSECVTHVNSVPGTDPLEEESTSVERCASNASRIEITILPGETKEGEQLGCVDVNSGVQLTGRPNLDVNRANGCVPGQGKDFGCGESLLWLKESVLSWIHSRHAKVDYLKKD